MNTIDELNREILALKEQFATNQQESNENLSDKIYAQLKSILPVSNEANLDDITSHINNLINENNLFKEKELSLTKDLENIKRQCEELLSEKPGEEIILLQTQCTQLDTANQAWQQFYDNQLNFLRNQFKDYLDLEKDTNFDQIIRKIATELSLGNSAVATTNNGIHLSPQSSTDSQQIESLQEEIESLENQLQESRSSIDLLKNNLQTITKENEQLKQQNHEIDEKYNQLLHSQIRVINPVQSSNNDEIDQLQEHISALTTRCTQLDQANHAWQEFHQNQLLPFREKLQESMPIDSNSSLEQIAQDILDQFGKIFLFSLIRILEIYSFRFSAKSITNLSIK